MRRLRALVRSMNHSPVSHLCMGSTGPVRRVVAVRVALRDLPVFVVDDVLGLSALRFGTARFDRFCLCLVCAGEGCGTFDTVSPGTVGVDCVNETVCHLELLSSVFERALPRIDRAA